MEEIKDDFVDFCKKCKTLVNFIPVIENFEWMVTWNKWLYITRASSYTGKVFGVDTNAWRKSIDARREKQDKRIEGLKWKDEFKKYISWQICTESFDLDLNLQWFVWSKTYWFDWLVKWL